MTQATIAGGTRAGRVSFVGLGPGDGGLLTLRAAERLSQADAVVVDRPNERAALLKRHCRAEVIVVDASFGADGTPMTQLARAKSLLATAAAFDHVVRLLDGDPAAVAGLADEIKACRRAGIDFEIVPGIAAAAAAPAYAGVILGSPDSAEVHTVNLGYGHAVDWHLHVSASVNVLLVGPEQEVRAGILELVAAGRSPETPAVVIADGASQQQRSVVGTAATVARTAAGLSPSRPVVAVLGNAANGCTTNSWFENRPLFGWQVLVPRTKEQANTVIELLDGFGAQAHSVPTISVESPRSSSQIDKAVAGLVSGRYAWIGFTSTNAVRAIREKFVDLGLDIRALAGVNVAAVGGATAQAVRDWGLTPDLVPSGEVEQSSRGLLEIWPEYEPSEDPMDRVFLPRADIATETLVEGLTELGWQVDDVTAYRTVRAAPPPAEVREAIKTGAFDAVLFTSSSTVRNLIGIAGKPHACTVVACIGPATAKTAQEHGLRVDVLAEEPSITALVTGLAAFGEALRLEAIGAGESVVRPSQRRSMSRRRAR